MPSRSDNSRRPITWPTRIQSTAMLRAANVFPVHTPQHAQVAARPLREGAEVKAGDMLLRLSAPDIDSRRTALTARVERLRWQASSAGFDTEQRSRSVVAQEELATAEAELAALEQDVARSTAPVAPFAGHLHDIEPDLAPGAWVAKGERLALLVGCDGYEVDAYLPADNVQRVAVGDRARFYAECLEGPFIALEVTAIDRDAPRVLPSGAWHPEHAVYHVRCALKDAPAELNGRSWRGKVVIAGDWEAPGMRFVCAFFAVLWRELGF
jgi:putative peptide zinc metalloprotease protein